MTFQLPHNFAADMNDLGMFVRMHDRLKKEETRRDHLLAGMKIGCSLLTDLNRSQRDLATGLDEIEAKTGEAVQLIRDHRELFLGIEDLILRDAGIEGITRKIILGNVRHLAAMNVNDWPEVSGARVLGTLKNLTEEICERVRSLDNPDRTKDRIGAVLTFGLAPINIAVSTSYPVFLPVVFKASAWAGNVVSRTILGR